jgi:hypothetical protein
MDRQTEEEIDKQTKEGQMDRQIDRLRDGGQWNEWMNEVWRTKLWMNEWGMENKGMNELGIEDKGMNEWGMED